ncbi:hypothetical protein [Siccirubricoccus phaeus]|uniref:hypothetical protein n=1 Tax=Siccirubricoccus phaeus TaxID=2595053 RepID=UPI0011F33B83|nr:hypothetical protein [Siccirubricoccus phaeus]
MNDTQKPPPAPRERAAGTIDRPIGTGDAQPGDRAERGADFGGPVDVFPTRRDRPGLEDPKATEEPDRDGTA